MPDVTCMPFWMPLLIWVTVVSHLNIALTYCPHFLFHFSATTKFIQKCDATLLLTITIERPCFFFYIFLSSHSWIFFILIFFNFYLRPLSIVLMGFFYNSVFPSLCGRQLLQRNKLVFFIFAWFHGCNVEFFTSLSHSPFSPLQRLPKLSHPSTSRTGRNKNHNVSLFQHLQKERKKKGNWQPITTRKQSNGPFF